MKILMIMEVNLMMEMVGKVEMPQRNTPMLQSTFCIAILFIPQCAISTGSDGGRTGARGGGYAMGCGACHRA